MVGVGFFRATEGLTREIALICMPACSQCGFSLKPDHSFCGGCGAKRSRSGPWLRTFVLVLLARLVYRIYRNHWVPNPDLEMWLLIAVAAGFLIFGPWGREVLAGANQQAKAEPPPDEWN